MGTGAIVLQLTRLEPEAEFSLHLVPTVNKGGFLAELSCVFMCTEGKFDTFRHNWKKDKKSQIVVLFLQIRDDRKGVKI
jgi:hypothetical protein